MKVWLVTLLATVGQLFAVCEVGGSRKDYWPPRSPFTNQTVVAEKIAEYHSKRLGWAQVAARGPYQRGGDYMNWSQAVYNPAIGPAVTNDASGVPMFSYDGRKTFVYNPVHISQHCFYLHSLMMKGEPLSPQFKVNADKLLELQGEDGALRYMFELPNLPSGRPSGMAQGHAISVWTRAYKIFGGEHYLEAAAKAYKFLMTPYDEGGCMGSLVDLDPSLSRYKMLQEYPLFPDHYVLNGSIFAMLGVYDWSEFDPSALCEFEKFLETIRAILPYYDVGGFTSTDLVHLSVGNKPATVSSEYHKVHIQLIWVLDSISPHPDLARTWRTWASYVNQPLKEPGNFSIGKSNGDIVIRWGLNTFGKLQRNYDPPSPIWNVVPVPEGQRHAIIEPTHKKAIYRMR